jgi:hypothetical protein
VSVDFDNSSTTLSHHEGRQPKRATKISRMGIGKRFVPLAQVLRQPPDEERSQPALERTHEEIRLAESRAHLLDEETPQPHESHCFSLQQALEVKQPK